MKPETESEKPETISEMEVEKSESSFDAKRPRKTHRINKRSTRK